MHSCRNLKRSRGSPQRVLLHEHLRNSLCVCMHTYRTCYACRQLSMFICTHTHSHSHTYMSHSVFFFRLRSRWQNPTAHFTYHVGLKVSFDFRGLGDLKPGLLFTGGSRPVPFRSGPLRRCHDSPEQERSWVSMPVRFATACDLS